MANPRHPHGTSIIFLNGKRALTLSGSAGRCGRGRLNGGFRRGRLQTGINPTSMYPPVKGLLGLGIDVSLPDQTAEGRLDMGAGAAETVVKVEVAKGSIEIVAPQQGYHAAAEPDALRVAGRAGQEAGSLGDLVDLFLSFLDCIGVWFLRLRGLAVSAALRERQPEW